MDKTNDLAESIYHPEIDISASRLLIKSSELAAFEQIGPSVYGADGARRKCEWILNGEWRLGGRGGEVQSLRPPVNWAGHSRSFAFQLNAWDPLSILLSGYSLLGDMRYFDAAYEAAVDWIRSYQVPVLSCCTIADLDALIGRPEDFIWYDMGVGQRIYMIAFIIDVIARDDRYSDAELKLFFKSLYFHHAALARPQFFRGHNNHGLYQAIGQLAAARRFPLLPGSAMYSELACRRFDQVCRTHIFPSGVHREHSPAYQKMILETLIGARSSALIDDPEMLARIDAMEEALAWMIGPDLRLTAFGDTDPKSVVVGGSSGRYRNPALIYLTSGGRDGTAPPEGVRTYLDEGFAFARMAGGKSYLAQIAAFHSRTHKHADHLSFVWLDRGRRIIVDAARYDYAGKTLPGSEAHREGFWYSDPKRMFVESTRAHNVVEVDGRDFPRVGVKPFGSGLVYADVQGGLVVFETVAPTMPSIQQRRVLVLHPGRFLLVLDLLTDKSGVERSYRQRFQLAPEWGIAEVDEGYRAVSDCSDDKAGPKLTIRSLLPHAKTMPPVRGQTEPQLEGWCSEDAGDLTPTSTFGFEQVSSAGVRFATLFAFGDDLEFNLSDQRLAPTLTTARLKWTIGGEAHTLSVLRGHQRTIKVEYDL